MPHTWEMVQRLVEPVTGLHGRADARSRRCSRRACSRSAIAARGWVVGVVVGLLLALLMQRFSIAESALLPWIVLSQTVPLIAIAPLVRRWGVADRDRLLRLGATSSRWP